MTRLAAWPASMVGLLAGCGFGIVYIAAAVATSPIMAVAAMGGALFLMVLMRAPVIGLYVLAAVVPVERFGRLSDDTASIEISIMRMIGMIVFAIVVVHLLLRHRRPLLTTPLLLWITYVTFAMLSPTADAAHDAAVPLRHCPCMPDLSGRAGSRAHLVALHCRRS